MPEFLAGLHEGPRHALRIGDVRHAERPVRPVPVARKDRVAFGAEEVLLDILEGPALAAFLVGPAVVVALGGRG